MTIKPPQAYPLGRINVRGEAYFDPKEGGKHLHNTLKNHWPKGAKVDILITPGGFIYEEIDGECGKENNRWKATLSDINVFVKRARKNVESMLKSKKILNAAQGKAKYISIGSDLWFVEDYSAELVFLVSVKSQKIVHWTGKSYPSSDHQERTLMQVTDLNTHFKKVLNHRVMILGCHDLNMFSHRAQNNAKKGSKRWKRMKEMAKLTKQFKPTMVIQHPHTTDTPNIWAGAWGGVRADYPSVETWASGISHYNYGRPLRDSFKRTIQHTKSENVLDITLKRK